MNIKIGIGILVVLFGLLVIYSDLISYGLMQAKGQYQVLSKAIPVEDFLSDVTVTDSLKVKLRLITKVKQFAFDTLGLNKNNSYTSIYDQKGKPILWNISASEEFKLEAYEWSFPFLGTFSYKGYFDYNKAIKEEEVLNKQGFDTQIRTVSGWSTLGWFNDPILSNMLHRKSGDLVELIVHELTHGTLYIKDSVDFNENLATFIGQKGAERFIAQEYGSKSMEMSEYLNNRADEKLFVSHMLRGAEKLDSLYNALTDHENLDLKRRLKKNMIKKICHSIDTLSLTAPGYKDLFKEELPNNTYFLSLMRYRAKLDVFETDYRVNYNANIQKYIFNLKTNYESL